MEIFQNAVGEYEALTVVVENEQEAGLPYFDLTTATTARLFVLRGSVVKEHAMVVVSTGLLQGGSQARVRYTPVDGDFPTIGDSRAYVRLTNDDGASVDSLPFMLNVRARF